MEIPEELLYTAEHEWVAIDGDVATVGITDYAQSELGDTGCVALPQVVDPTVQMQPFGTVEAVKAVSDLYAPVSGEVVEVNGELEEKPELVNEAPYGAGWLIKIKMNNPSEVDQLLSADDYRKQVS